MLIFFHSNIHLLKGGNMEHIRHVRGFPPNHMFQAETGSSEWLCMAVAVVGVCFSVCVCVCVMPAAPWTPANVMSVGFLKAGSLSRVLHEPLRRATFTATGASGLDYPLRFIRSRIV